MPQMSSDELDPKNRGYRPRPAHVAVTLGLALGLTFTVATYPAKADDVTTSGLTSITTTTTANASDANASASKVASARTPVYPSATITVNTGLPRKISVPYGVDVATWLSAPQREQLLFTLNSTTYPRVAACFKNGQTFVLTDPAGAYPTSTGGKHLSDFLSFGTARAGVSVPSIGKVDNLVALPETPTTATDIDLAPEDILSTLKMRGKGNEQHDLVIDTSQSGTLRVWANGDDTALEADETLTSNVPTLSNSYELKADGTFSSDKTGTSVKLTDLTDSSAYVKPAQDLTATDPATSTRRGYSAGQVLRVTLARDTLDPTIGSTSLSGTLASNKPIDASTCWISNGTLTTSQDGIVLTMSVADAGASNPNPNNEETSGIDKAILTVGGKDITGTLDGNGNVSFTLSAATLGADGASSLKTYDLSTATVHVFDVAGNETTESLSTLLSNSSNAALKTVSKLRLILATDKPTVSLLATGDADDPKDESGSVKTSNAESVGVTLTLTDPIFSELRDDATWKPFTIKIDDDEQQVTLDDFQLVSGTQNTYQISLQNVTVEGKHTVTVEYKGAASKFSSLENTSDSDSVSFLVDRTVPRATDMQVKDGIDLASVSTVGNENIFVSGATTLNFKVSDPTSDTVADVSGVESVTAEAVRYDSLTATSGETLTLPVVEENGTYSVMLVKDGYYKLEDVKLTLTDKAGNSTTVPMELSAGTGDDAKDITGIAVETVMPDQSSDEFPYGLSVVTGDTSETFDVSGRTFYSSDVHAVFSVRDILTDIVSHSPSFTDSFSASMTNASGTNDLSSVAGELSPVEDGSEWYQTDIAFTRTADGALPDGWYEASFYRYHVWPSSEVSFGIDTTPPQVTDAQFEGNHDVAEMDDGTKILVGSERTIKVRVQDLFPRSEDQVADVSTANEQGTSGVDPASVTVSLSSTTGLGSNATTVQSEQTLTPDENGWITITLADEGLYSLDDITISAKDNCDNVDPITLGSYVSSLSDADREAGNWDFDKILVDSSDDVELSAIVVDDQDTPKSASDHYHLGEAKIEVTVTDSWLPIYRKLDPDASLITATVRKPGETTDTVADLALTPSSFEATDDTKTTWKAVVSLPRATGSDKPQEGEYNVTVSYQGSKRYATHEEPYSWPLDFGVDYTAPELGTLEFSQTSPFPCYTAGEHRDEPWGWVFSTDAERGTVTVRDNLSGVNEDSLLINGIGTFDLEKGYDKKDDSPLEGTAWLSFDTDGERLTLENSTLSISDVAGNTAVIDNFAATDATNLPQGATNIAVDTEAPQISVSYDNNDVRNGVYYNAARTATITVSESNFDLLQAYAPDTQIAAAYRDGSDYPAMSLTAKDFKAQTLDDGSVVYVGTLTFEDDADWRLDSSFTDPAGHESNVYTDSFVVDKTAPSLMVEYDNNEVANAMYYKAPRTATISVYDKNFSPELGTIDATTLTGGTSPVVGGWSEVETRSEWQAQASFSGETHYQLKVTVTDLAGNVAEAYDSGEFVIDMTAPEVSVTGIENAHAYSGDVAPTIAYSDLNLDTLGSDYQVEGARQGQTYFMSDWENETDTTKNVGLRNLPYEVDQDDVYVFTANGVDLAGNQTQQTVVFSVNRFGSTYYFGDSSANVAGSYLTEPQDVQVIEVNVSGLNTAASRVSLAQDDRTRSLTAGTDYVLEPNANDNGWSATTYTFPARLFQEDGFYRVTLTSTDAAGNLSQNTMAGKGSDGTSDFPVAFAVDSTKPTAALIGIDEETTYLNPDMSALADASDNLGLASVKVYVDGSEASSWDSSQEKSDLWVKLPADGQLHSYRIVATDKAGNVSEAVYHNVRVTDDPIEYVINTPRLLSAAIGVLIIAAGVVAAAVVLARRRYRANEAKRNPFGH